MAALSRNGKYVSLEDVRVWLDHESGEVSVSSSDTDLRGPFRLTARLGTNAASVLTELLADHGLGAPSREAPEGGRDGGNRVILVASSARRGASRLAEDVASAIALGTRFGRTVPPVYLLTVDPDGGGSDLSPEDLDGVAPDGDGVRRVRPLSGTALREAVWRARGSAGYVVVDASLSSPSSVSPELAAIVDHVVTTGPAPLDDPEALDLSLHHLVVIERSLGLDVRDGSFATVVLETSGGAPGSGLDRDLAMVRARHLSDELLGEVVVTHPLPAVTDSRHAAVAARVLDALGVRLLGRGPAPRSPRVGRRRR